MSTEDLRTIVQRLQAEIDAIEGDRPEARARLDALVAELAERLEEVSEDAEHADLIERIQTGIEHFEVEYPRATAILNDLMVKLSSMGI